MKKIIYLVMFVAVLVFVAGCEECPTSNKDCPAVTESHCGNGVRFYSEHYRYFKEEDHFLGTGKCELTGDPNNYSKPDANCPEKPPQRDCRGRATCIQPGQNAGICPNKASTATSHSPLEF